MPLFFNVVVHINHFILISDTDWGTSVLDSTKSKDDAWFDTFLTSSKLEYHAPFDMHGVYVDGTIVQDTDLHHFDTNTYDEDYEFTFDSCVLHASTLQPNEHNLLS